MGGQNEELVFNGPVLVWEDEKVLETDDGDVCTTKCTRTAHLKIVKIVKFYVMCIPPQ